MFVALFFLLVFANALAALFVLNAVIERLAGARPPAMPPF